MNKFNNLNNINRDYDILEIADEMAKKLNVDGNKLQSIIMQKISPNNRLITDRELLQKIFNLLKSDADIDTFKTKITNPSVMNNFNLMKEKLGELQILTLAKKLHKSENCDDVLNTFVNVLNNKIDTVNEILEDTLIQSGGSKNDQSIFNEKYYVKYLKYKLKNKELEFLISNN